MKQDRGEECQTCFVSQAWQGHEAERLHECQAGRDGKGCVYFCSSNLPLSLCVHSIGSNNKINTPACVWTCREECMSRWRGEASVQVRVVPQARRPFPSHQLLRCRDPLRALKGGLQVRRPRIRRAFKAFALCTHVHTCMAWRRIVIWTYMTELREANQDFKGQLMFEKFKVTVVFFKINSSQHKETAFVLK